jgi:hypothetical protein
MANDNSKKSPGALLEANVPGAPGTLNAVVTGALAGVGGSGGVAEQFTQLTQQIQQSQTVGQAQTESILVNTQALNQNTTQLVSTPVGQAGSSASRAEGTLQSFGLGLGLSPLITGLLSLFGGGGSSSQTAAPVKFSLPPSVGVNAGVSEAGPTSPFSVDYAAGGQPRPATTASTGPQITVQVQALDSQSFLDHSQDIAMAVRRAMLESGVLSDVIREV